MAKKTDWVSLAGWLTNLKIFYDRGLSVRYLIYRLKWNLLVRNFRLLKFPLHLDVEATINCNLRCRMCFQDSITYKRGFMDFNLYKKIIDEGAKNGLASIKLNWRGEPLLHPRIADMIKYAKSKGLVDVQFLTNATLLNEEKALEILESGLDQIVFSLEGTTKETYEKIRRGANYEKTMSNIKAFLKLKKQKGLKKPIVRIQTVRMKETEKEIKDFISYWKNLVDYVSICNYIEFDEEKRRKLRSKEVRRKACNQPWQRFSISWNGDVSICCRDYNSGLIIGNVKNQSIRELWNSKKMQGIRKLFINGELDRIPICRFCDSKETYE